ncbi:PA2169 family four-helix-bundle protein [Leeuwenhoekiella sp. NPDC079379]|uniref:PA2169 family four-helix-bundle protein n=1 Tax=Leeuwenhoekiella sp. NPDC079379 TaxID=3364122 RepID=UPI0037C5BA9F
MKFTEKISNKLNELLTKNYDAEAGYKLASDHTENGTLKDYFNRKAKERYDFGHHIKNEIKAYGETPDKGTSLAGDAHRAWMNIKSTVTSNSEEALLKETIRGENNAIEEYKTILNEPHLPPTTEAILKNQLSTIESTLKEVKAFEIMA